MSKEVEIGVSTATFIRAQNPPLIGHIPEVEAAVLSAKNLGIGLEVVYRNSAQKKIIERCWESNVPVFQIHGPIFYDLADGVRAGMAEPSKSWVAVNPLLGILSLGTLRRDFEATLTFARNLGVSRVVLHPRGAEILYKKGLVNASPEGDFSVAIEPDWRRPKESEHWVWQPEKVLEIAEKNGGGICMDTSHTSMSLNSVDHLVSLYEKYKKAPKGVLSIHLAAVIPDTEAYWILGRKKAGLPLDPRYVPPQALGAFREFYQHLRLDNFSGPVIIELFNFPGGYSLEQRKKAVEITLESLNSGKNSEASISLSGKTTSRPI